MRFRGARAPDHGVERAGSGPGPGQGLGASPRPRNPRIESGRLLGQQHNNKFEANQGVALMGHMGRVVKVMNDEDYTYIFKRNNPIHRKCISVLHTQCVILIFLHGFLRKRTAYEL